MALTVDWLNRIVDSSTSINDIVAVKAELRELEDSEAGMIYPPIISYKELDLGGGSKFPSIDFINGYKLRFSTPGNYFIKGGNLNATIVPVAGVFVERVTSASYAVTSVGGGGASAQQIASAVREELSTELSHLSSLQNGMGLNTTQATMLLEIYRLYGLDPTRPLVVTDTSRKVGDIDQTISSNQNSTTIMRR